MEKMTVAVMDGQGGGIGRALVEQIKKSYPQLCIRVLGTNAVATSNMMRGGADEGATGANAIIFNAAHVEVILGPVAIIMANGLLGEVTPAMAAAVGSSGATKILIPSQRCRVRMAVGEDQPLHVYLKDAVRLLGEELQNWEE